MADDGADTHFCLCCHVTIIGLEEYVTHKRSLCSALKKTAHEPITTRAAPDPSIILFTPPSSSAPVDPSIGDFLSSLDLQMRPKEIVVPKRGNDVFESNKQLGSILNDLEFNSDSEDFMDPDDILDFNYEDVEQRPRGGKPSGKLMASFKKIPEKRKNEHAGKWIPGERPSQPTRGKWHSIGKQKIYPDDDDDEEEEEEEEVEVVERSVVVEKNPSGEIQQRNVASDHSYRKPDDEVVETEILFTFKCLPCDKVLGNKFNYSRHLASALHKRRAGDSNGVEERVVPLCKFQCRVCAFGSDEKTVFWQHCLSPLHEGNTRDLLGPVKCTACRFSSRDVQEMLEHLNSKDHDEKVVNTSRLCVLKELRSGLTCPFCNVVKSSASSYKTHMLLHKAKKNYVPIRKGVRTTRKCKECEREFRDAFNLAVHVKRVHIKERNFACEQCGVAFVDSSSLQLHLKSRRHLSRLIHMSTNMSTSITATPTSKKYKCAACTFVTDEPKQLRPHYITEHTKGALFCDVCGVTFRTKRQQLRHMKSAQHNAKQKICADNSPSECDVCGEKFYDPQKFQLHQTVHLTAEGYNAGDLSEDSAVKVQCPVCNISTSRALMQSHLRFHTKSSYSCIQCGKSFTDKNILRRHLQTHLGIKPFKCRICAMDFVLQKSLTAHLAKTHHESKTTKHVCSDCGKTFLNLSQFNVHIKRHHPSENRPIVCDLCSKRFLFKSELVRHLRTHTNDRPYLCDQCDYRGKSRSELNRHLLSHSGEKNFVCDYCTYKGSTSANLRRHMRLHTGAKPYHCPYCEYTCNSLENLGKHVKRSRKHPQMKLYLCQLCKIFSTDSAKEFREHLAAVHDEKSDELCSVLAGIYHKNSDAYVVAEGSQALPLRETKRGKVSDNQFGENIAQTLKI